MSAYGLPLPLLLQIEPREVEINEMRETIRAMDAELERYHKSNAGLDLTIQVRTAAGGSHIVNPVTGTPPQKSHCWSEYAL